MRAALWTPFALSRGTVASAGAKRGVICLLRKRGNVNAGQKGFFLGCRYYHNKYNNNGVPVYRRFFQGEYGMKTIEILDEHSSS
jgi:hypothetical protein